MKKIIASLFATLVLASASAYAQNNPQDSAPAADPAATKAVQQLFASMNYRALMLGAMQQMSKSFDGQMRGNAQAAINNNPKLTDADKAKALADLNTKLDAATKAVNAILNDPGLVDEILDATVPIYAHTFTVAEIEQISAFYQSPVGAKMLAVTPQLMSEGMQVGQRIVGRKIGPLIQQLQSPQK